jgi:hypothetical protein
MPAELSECFVNPFPVNENDSTWYNPKNDMESQVQQPVEQPVEVEPPTPEPVPVAIEEPKMSFFNKVKSNFGKESTKNKFLWIMFILIVVILVYLAINKMMDTGIPNEL